MSNTVCRTCNREVKEEHYKITDRYVNCPRCGMFVTIGNKSNVEQYRKVKGGIKLEMAKENIKKEKPVKIPKEKVEKVKGPNIGEIREQNAKTLITYLNTELKLDNVEKRKVLSRTYGIISQSMKK